MLSLEEAGGAANAAATTAAATAAAAAADSADTAATAAATAAVATAASAAATAASAAAAAAADWHSGGAVQQLLEELAQNVDLISSAEASRYPREGEEGQSSPHMIPVPNASTGEDRPPELLP
jgi:hypothetical protein